MSSLSLDLLSQFFGAHGGELQNEATYNILVHIVIGCYLQRAFGKCMRLGHCPVTANNRW